MCIARQLLRTLKAMLCVTLGIGAWHRAGLRLASCTLSAAGAPMPRYFSPGCQLRLRLRARIGQTSSIAVGAARFLPGARTSCQQCGWRFHLSLVALAARLGGTQWHACTPPCGRRTIARRSVLRKIGDKRCTDLGGPPRSIAAGCRLCSVSKAIARGGRGHSAGCCPGPLFRYCFVSPQEGQVLVGSITIWQGRGGSEAKCRQPGVFISRGEWTVRCYGGVLFSSIPSVARMPPALLGKPYGTIRGWSADCPIGSSRALCEDLAARREKRCAHGLQGAVQGTSQGFYRLVLPCEGPRLNAVSYASMVLTSPGQG